MRVSSSIAIAYESVSRAGAAVLLRDRHAHQPELGQLGDELVREAVLAVELLGDRRDPLARRTRGPCCGASSCSSVRSKFTRRSLRRQLGDQADAVAGAARLRRGSRRASASRKPVPAMSRCAHGPSPANSSQELGREDRRACAQHRRVLHVGERRVDVAAVARVQRQRPGVVAARLAGGDDLVAPLVVVREDARVEVAERELHRAGQRREVERGASRPARRAYQSASASTRRPSASVFDDLDRLAVRGASGCRRAGTRRRRRHVLASAATTASMRTGRPSSAIAPMPSITRRRRRPCRPSCPPCTSAGLIEMPPVSNVIALPTRPSRTSLRARRRVVAQDDQPRPGCGCPGATAAKRAHPELVDLLRAERLGREVLVRGGELGRRSASRSGVSSFGGAFARSRARFAALGDVAARSAASTGSSASRRARGARRRARCFASRLPAPRVVRAEQRAPRRPRAPAPRAASGSDSSRSQASVPPTRPAASATAAAAVRSASASSRSRGRARRGRPAAGRPRDRGPPCDRPSLRRPPRRPRATRRRGTKRPRESRSARRERRRRLHPQETRKRGGHRPA